MNLITLSLYEETNAMDVVLRVENEVKLQWLTSAMTSSKMFDKYIYASQIRYFDEGEGTRAGQCWNPYYCIVCHSLILSSGPEDVLNCYEFLLAIFLAKGERLAMVPIYFASLYSWLNECVSNTNLLLGLYDIVACTSLLQMFIQERFRALEAKPIEYFGMLLSEAGGVGSLWQKKNMFQGLPVTLGWCEAIE